MSNYKSGFENGEIEFNVVKRLGVLASYNTGWNKEVNIISWNKNPAKLDIRDWDPEHEHMSKGVTLHEEEAYKLLRVLKNQFENPEEGTKINGTGWDTASKSQDFEQMENEARKECEEHMTRATEESKDV